MNRVWWPHFIYFVLLSVALPGTLHATDEDWGDDDASFIDMATTVERQKPLAQWRNIFQLRYRSFLDLWTQRFDGQSLAGARQSVTIKVHKKWPNIYVHGDFSGEIDLGHALGIIVTEAEVRHVYQQQFFVREAYVGFSLGTLEMTVGRQVMTLGSADLAAVIDPINPLDMREPGSAEGEDIKLGLTMTRVGFHFARHRLEAIAIHEAQSGLRSPPTGPYALIPKTMPEPLQSALTGRHGRFSNQQSDYGSHGGMLRLSLNLSQLDLSAYGGWLREAYLESPMLQNLFHDRHPLTLPFAYDGYPMAAIAASWGYHKWVTTFEAIHRNGRHYFIESDTHLFATQAIAAWSMHIGMRYQFSADWTLAIATKRNWLDQHRPLLRQVEKNDVYVRLQGQSERVHIAWLAAYQGADASAYSRVDLGFDMDDHLRVSLAFVKWLSEVGAVTNFDSHDRLRIAIRYDI